MLLSCYIFTNFSSKNRLSIEIYICTTTKKSNAPTFFLELSSWWWMRHFPWIFLKSFTLFNLVYFQSTKITHISNMGIITSTYMHIFTAYPKWDKGLSFFWRISLIVKIVPTPETAIQNTHIVTKYNGITEQYISFIYFQNIKGPIIQPLNTTFHVHQNNEV